MSIILVALGLGGLLWNVRHVGPIGDPVCWYLVEHPGRYTIEGRVRLSDLEEANPQQYQFVVDVERLVAGKEVLAMNGGVLVRWYRPSAPVYAGECVRVSGNTSIALANVNPNTGSYEQYLRLRGIHSTMRTGGVTGVKRIGDASWYSGRYWASRFRLWQAERFREVIPEKTLPFVYACWLGFSQTVNAEEYQAYIESGTAHILSVSGIHTAMVFASASFLLKLFMRDRRKRAALIMFAVMAFAVMAGVRLSGIRAALMVVVYMAADLVDREPDAPTALSLSIIAMLGWHPDSLFDGGFQLSFLSMASILLFVNPLYAVLGRLPVQLRGAVATSLGVQVLPTPVAIGMFHILPLGSVLANLVVVPLCTAALWMCFLVAVCATVSSRLALIFGHAAMPVVELIRLTARAVASQDFSYLVITSPTAAAAYAYWGAVACGAAGILGRRKRQWVLVCGVLIVVTIIFWNPPAPPEPEVVFLDVGHGDSIFVRVRGGETMLVDGGNRANRADAGRRVVAPFLWSSHVKRLDYVAVSHPDSDHIGGLFYVLENFEVGTVLMSAAVTDAKLEASFLEKCDALNIPVRRLSKRERLQMGDAVIDVLHPPADWPESSEVNDTSLVLKLSMSGLSVLLTGDVMTSAETAIVNTPERCDANVLKVPHHGSSTSSSQALIQAVSPEFAIISTGGEHGREHVDQGVLARYRRHGVTIFRTDHEGGIRLSITDGNWTVEGARQRLGYPRPHQPQPLSSSQPHR